jgi:hypothetical protein
VDDVLAELEADRVACPSGDGPSRSTARGTRLDCPGVTEHAPTLARPRCRSRRCPQEERRPVRQRFVNVAAVVVVKTDHGYAPDPGHAGTRDGGRGGLPTALISRKTPDGLALLLLATDLVTIAAVAKVDDPVGCCLMS